MHETNKEELTTDEVLSQLRLNNELLEQLIEVNMAVLIQLSKLYDVAAFTAVSNSSKDVVVSDALEEILDGHEQGYIASTEPVLRGFAAKDEDA